MAVLTWDQVGERLYETGVDRGVLYLPNSTGVYATGYAWNGLTTVTESPSGAEATAQYADNIQGGSRSSAGNDQGLRCMVGRKKGAFNPGKPFAKMYSSAFRVVANSVDPD